MTDTPNIPEAEVDTAEQPPARPTIIPVIDPDAYPPIRLLGLTLRGVRRNYVVDFTDDNEVGIPLSLIAGEISTGKTTVLEFIDYCLGASSHPSHPEVIANVRAAQLAIEVLERAGDSDENDNGSGAGGSGDASVAGSGAHLARYVIERPVGGVTGSVMLFRGDQHGFDDSSPRRLTMTPSDTDSLSQFLLRACGLAGLRLRQAPAKEDSATSILSFRDVMPLAFLAYTRIGGNDLVYEKQPARTIKLRQVVDYMFDVSDQEFSDVSSQIEVLRKELNDAQAGLRTLRAFLIESGVRDEDDIRTQASALRARRARATEQLAEINTRLSASTEFAAATRASYNGAAQRAREIFAQIRDRDTLLGRLATLRSQYTDDLHKVDLLAETQQLFDALSVTVCPACQNALPEPVAIADGNCSLCRQLIVPDAVDGPGSSGIDLTRERRNLKRRLNELTAFVNEVSGEVTALTAQQRETQSALIQAQQQLDASTASAIAPFITERDQLTNTIAGIDSELGTLGGHFRMQRQLTERERERERIGGALIQARERRKLLEQNQRERDEVIGLLTERFGQLLGQFGYPKLTDPHFDRALIPHVRGSRYDQVGSAGAMTLIALAWQLTVFELAVEQGHAHPGFLMIDSPQKGLRQVSGSEAPADGGVGEDIASEAASIVDRVYRHIQTWLARHAGRAQIIIVDNEPPASVNGSAVVVRYGGATGAPPYGLIADAID